MIEIRNAIIESTSLTIAERDLLDAWLHLDYGGSGQGFGGYALYLPESYRNHTKAGDFAGHFIYRVLKIAGADEWSKLKGRTIRVRADHGQIHAIGHIVKDDWFVPAEDFQKIRDALGKSGESR